MLKLINQPFNNHNLGSHIAECLSSKEFSSFQFVIAYSKMSGIKHLSQLMLTFKLAGGRIIGTIGIDQHNTSLEAVLSLFNLCDELYIYHSESISQTLHPKIYCFKSATKSTIFCGSNNLTEGGLYTNYETSLMYELDLSSQESQSFVNDIDLLFSEYKNTSKACCKLVTSDLIKDLFSEGYLFTEKHIAFSNRQQNQRKSSVKIFGSENFPAPTIIGSSNEAQGGITTNNNLFINSTKIDTYKSLYGSFGSYVSRVNRDYNYYHIPQGVHLGHIFYIIKAVGDGQALDYRLSIFNNPTNSSTVRQTKYKIGCCMELLLLEDFRTNSSANFQLKLTNNGQILYDILERNVNDIHFFNFSSSEDATWKMYYNNTNYFIQFIKTLNDADKKVLFSLFENLEIYKLLINYIRSQPSPIPTQKIYNDFWYTGEVQAYLKTIKSSVPTRTSMEHRIPFLLTLIDSFSEFI